MAVGNPLEFVVARRGDREGAVSADLEFLPGGSAQDCNSDCKEIALPPALPGIHFQAANQRVSFASGETEPKRIVVPILPDGEPHGDRFFTARLRNPEGGSADESSMNVGILDSELPAHVDVTRPTEPEQRLVLLGGSETHTPPQLRLASVRSFPLPGGGKIVVGAFTHVNGVPRPGLAWLDANDELEDVFAPAGLSIPWGLASSVLTQLRNGAFLLTNPQNNGFARLLPTGVLDASFPTNLIAEFDSEPGFAAEAPDGTILAGPNGAKLQRISANGLPLDPLTIPDLIHPYSYKLGYTPVRFDSAGRLLVTGIFNDSTADGLASVVIRRFLADGSRDGSFQEIRGRLLLIVTDGRLVVADRADTPVPIKLYLPDGTPDSSWPETVLEGGAQPPPPVETAHEVNGKLRIRGVYRVNGLWTGMNSNQRQVEFFLTGAPKTALHWESRHLVSVDSDPWWTDCVEEPGPGEVSGFKIVLRRLGSTAKSATVRYTTRDLTTTAGKDYEAQSGTVTFAPFEVEKTLAIPIFADTEREWDETFELLVTGAEGFEALPAPLRLTIRDGNGPTPWLDRVKRLRDGRVLLGGSRTVDGERGVIDTSTDLINWKRLSDALGGELSDRSGSLWLDASATNAPTRYYRAVTP